MNKIHLTGALFADKFVMPLLISILARFIFLLHSAAAPAQIAAGFCLGMIIGLTPSLLVNILFFLMVLTLNVNIGSAFLATLIFRTIAYLGDPFFNAFGYSLLVDMSLLRGLWTFLYDLPFVPLTGFNNSVVSGSFLSALILLIPVYMVTFKGTIIYRSRYSSKVKRLPVIRALRATHAYIVYQHVRKLGEQLWR